MRSSDTRRVISRRGTEWVITLGDNYATLTPFSKNQVPPVHLAFAGIWHVAGSVQESSCSPSGVSAMDFPSSPHPTKLILVTLVERRSSFLGPPFVPIGVNSAVRGRSCILLNALSRGNVPIEIRMVYFHSAWRFHLHIGIDLECMQA